jgi:hypothetical protein
MANLILLMCIYNPYVLPCDIYENRCMHYLVLYMMATKVQVYI